MKLVNKKASELKEAEYNPRKISDKDLDQLKKSIENFDMVEPLVVNMFKSRVGVIVGGHQRFKAMKSLGYTEFPCVEVRLPKKREKELNIRLNKNNGEFDFDLLAEHFDTDDLLDFGFEDWELDLKINDEEDDDINLAGDPNYIIKINCNQEQYKRLMKKFNTEKPEISATDLIEEL